MEFEQNEFGEELCCIWKGFAYSRREEHDATKIREMPDGENKKFAIKHFEVRTGKKFPEESCIEFGFNPDTALVTPEERRRGINFLFEHPRLARKSFPLI